MIIRIVKMEFRPDEVDAFVALFEQHRCAIRSFPGCEKLELLQDRDQPSVFMTYSHWKNAESLENYRTSEVFSHIWPKTKALFASSPQAWSLTSRFSD